MWPVLMSAWFNIRTDLYQASVTCWLTSWAQCTLDRQKGEELKVQRPPSCGISHSSIDLGGGGGVTQECETSQGCVSCAFHCREASSAWYCPCVLVYMSRCLQVALYSFSEVKVQIGPWSVLWLLFEELMVSLHWAFGTQFWCCLKHSVQVRKPTALIWKSGINKNQLISY